MLAEGGVLDTVLLAPWLELGRAAMRSEKTVLISHSEVFPGTFASTTETADWLISALGLARSPLLAWGPAGMQQLSEVRSGRLLIRGFAGNSAYDHLDHFHGLADFLASCERCSRRNERGHESPFPSRALTSPQLNRRNPFSVFRIRSRRPRRFAVPFARTA